MRKAYLYQRFSSEKQKGNSSLYRQTEAQDKWLLKNPDVKVAGRYVDDGLSGFKGDHLKKGALKVLVDQIEQGLVDEGSIILVEQFSRLSRLPISDTEKLLFKIWDAGITIVTVTDNQEYTPEAKDDMQKRIKLLVEIESASKESQWRQEKVKASYKRREEKASEGVTPRMRRAFWLTKEGKLNSNHQVIKDIFNLYEEGNGQQRIIVELRKRYPTLKAVQKMNPSTVMRWLKSETVLGKWKGHEVYEAAITQDQFDSVEEIHAERLYENVKPDRNWPLSGLMQCGVCGRGMSIQKSKKTLPVVRCSSKQRDRSCNRKTTFPYFIAHQYMFSTVLKKALYKYTQNTSSSEYRTRIVQIDRDLMKLRSKVADEKAHYKKATSQGKTAGILLDMIIETGEEIDVLENERIEIKKAISKIKSLPISKEAGDLVLTPRSFNLEMHKLDFKIIVGEDRLTTIGFNEPAPTMIYRGYSRKTLSYNYSLGGIEFEFPTKWIKESALMLEGVANENGELPKSYSEIFNKSNLAASDIDSLSPEDKLIRQKETVAMFKSLLEEKSNS